MPAEKLLCIHASPRGARSWSSRVAQVFMTTYRQRHASAPMQELNIFEMALPEFNGAVLDAKYAIMHGEKPTPAQCAAWLAVETVINEFKNAGKYVVAVPMWNFGIPYRLKHYLDLLIQPGYTFTYSQEHGYQGLITGRPLCLIGASGGDYSAPAAQALDFHLRYLATAFGFIGFTNIRTVRVAPTMQGDPEAAYRAACTDVARIAEEF